MSKPSDTIKVHRLFFGLAVLVLPEEAVKPVYDVIKAAGTVEYVDVHRVIAEQFLFTTRAALQEKLHGSGISVDQIIKSPVGDKLELTSTGEEVLRTLGSSQH